MDSAELKPRVSTSATYLEKARLLAEVTKAKNRLMKIENTLKDDFRNYMGPKCNELHLAGYRIQKQPGVNTGLDAASVRKYLSPETFALCIRETPYTKIVVSAL